MRRERREPLELILSGLGILAGMAAVGLRLRRALSELMVQSALDRHPPKLLRAISPAKQPSETRKRADAAAARLRAMNPEGLELDAGDGLRLRGHWVPAEQPRRVILAMHGWRSSWDRDFGAIAEFWRREGCSVLYAEQRAHGESGGAYLGFGLLERYDVLRWLELLQSSGKAGDNPVYLAGISMGATTVLMAAGLSLPKQVHGVIADCGFTSAPDIWQRVLERMQPLPYGFWREPVESLAAERLECPPDAESTLAAVARSRTPILFVHGLADRFVPPEMSEANYAACRAPKRILLVPGGHGLSYGTDPERYEAALREFWASFDG